MQLSFSVSNINISMNYINAYCRIDNQQVIVNGQCVLPCDDSDPKMWAGSIYRWLGIQYPKFFKMDTLCKFGFLASELIMKQLTLSPEEPKKDWAMLCLNACSSIDTDRHYQTTIQNADNYYPSPSVFVYTLANIVTGEIAIRHKLMGESSTYIFDTLNPDTLCALVNNAIGENRANNALCGWINYDSGVCDVMMFAVSAQKSGDFGKEWTSENIKQCMMKQTWRNFYI